VYLDGSGCDKHGFSQEGRYTLLHKKLGFLNLPERVCLLERFAVRQQIRPSLPGGSQQEAVSAVSMHSAASSAVISI
jgi:hypothetical protein